MNRPTRRGVALTGLGLTGVAGVLTVALATGPAFAEDPTPAPSSSAGTAAPADDRAQRQQEFAAALAKELGVDQAKVTAALEKVRTAQQQQHQTERQAQLKTRLDAAVKEGKLTAEQSAAILKAAEAGVLSDGGHGPGPGGPGGPGGPAGPGGLGGPGGWPGR